MKTTNSIESPYLSNFIPAKTFQSDLMQSTPEHKLLAKLYIIYSNLTNLILLQNFTVFSFNRTVGQPIIACASNHWWNEVTTERNQT